MVSSSLGSLLFAKYQKVLLSLWGEGCGGPLPHIPPIYIYQIIFRGSKELCLSLLLLSSYHQDKEV